MKKDIESILNGIDTANADLASNLPIREVQIYQMGFCAALKAVAVAFNIQLTPKHEANTHQLLSAIDQS